MAFLRVQFDMDIVPCGQMPSARHRPVQSFRNVGIALEARLVASNFGRNVAPVRHP
jgi:hypothetical protein